MSNRSEALDRLLAVAERAQAKDVEWVATWATNELERRIAAQTDDEHPEQQHSEAQEDGEYDPVAAGKAMAARQKASQDPNDIRFR